jgi:hypothetical protein
MDISWSEMRIVASMTEEPTRDNEETILINPANGKSD